MSIYKPAIELFFLELAREAKLIEGAGDNVESGIRKLIKLVSHFSLVGIKSPTISSIVDHIVDAKIDDKLLMSLTAKLHYHLTGLGIDPDKVAENVHVELMGIFNKWYMYDDSILNLPNVTEYDPVDDREASKFGWVTFITLAHLNSGFITDVFSNATPLPDLRLLIDKYKTIVYG